MATSPYTFLGTRNSSEGTSRINLREGTLLIGIGQYAYLEPFEVTEIQISGRYILVAGIAPGATPAGSGSESGPPSPPPFIPYSQRGAASGVAELDATAKVPAAQLPAVVSRSSAPLFEGSGTRKPNLAEGSVFPLKATGSLAIQAPEGIPPSVCYSVLLEIYMDAVGKRAITFPGMEPLGLAPVIGEAANELTLVELFTNNQGASWFVIGMVQGGVGPEGFVASKFELPEALAVFNDNTANATANRACLFESVKRGESAVSTILLTSGQPIGTLVTVPAGKIFTAASVGVATAEATPAEREHLWLCVTDLTGKVLAVTADYTSSVNTPMENGKIRGMKWAAAIAASAEVKQYIVYVMNKTKSGNPLTLQAVKGAAFMMSPAPKLAVLGNVGMNAPPTVGETLEMKETGNRIWVGCS